MKSSLIAVGLSSVVASSASAALVAAWDFQTTTTGGTAVASSPACPKAFVANFGSGNLYLDGTNSSSNFFEATSGSTNTEINSFGGTALNASGGMSTVTSGQGALAVVGGLALAANGKAMVFKFSMSGLGNLGVTYAAQRTTTGFTTAQWDYSTDGTNWFAAATVTPIQASFTLGVGSITSLGVATGLNNAATAYMRVTFTGATNSGGNNRMDNFIFNADAVPAPGAAALVGLAGLVSRRRR